ncbi:hypothetical protein [Argonema galeatum]|uniref:hypothetical protein n=1 Tax=Argonema galeatum TaxID=2942762 RepID=UPI002012C5A5|nr:hypothetical protein [Argonema galeatum]MCL1466860.1 hypothetical protein [Argonema galeatum A003/A1]
MISSKVRVEPLNLSNPQVLLSTLQQLRQTVESEGQPTFSQWRSQIQRPEFLFSALNLADYLALRRHDLPSQKDTTCFQAICTLIVGYSMRIIFNLLLFMARRDGIL